MSRLNLPPLRTSPDGTIAAGLLEAFARTLRDWARHVDHRHDQIEARVNTVERSLLSGTGSPETVVAAPVGSLYLRSDGGASTTLYVKETGGTGNTGWTAK